MKLNFNFNLDILTQTGPGVSAEAQGKKSGG
jgi:hypothetical protein